MKTVILPIPVDEEIAELVSQGAKATGLKKADVIRHGLRLGVPALVQTLTASNARRRPKCFDYIDEYPNATVAAKNVEKALRKRTAKEYGHANG
jgi:hypothetical protein